MNTFFLEQATIAQNKFSESPDVRQLILSAAHFLSLTIQPKEILFCTVSETLQCFAHYSEGQPLRYNELSPLKVDACVCLDDLWEFTDKPHDLSDCLSLSVLTNKDNWGCFKLLCGEQSVYIFIHNPVEEAIHIWTHQPLLSSVLLQFAHKLMRFRLYRQYQLKITTRDKEDALNVQELKLQKEFVARILTLQQVTLDLANCDTLDDLYKHAVETLRDDLGFDRTCLFLVDESAFRVSSTYGTDADGKTTDESSYYYERSKMVSELLQASFDSQQCLTVVEQAPLYTMEKIVGSGWNAMVILRSGDHILGWVALDNLINQRPLLNYQRQLLEAYGAMLSQAIVRKSEEHNLKILHNCMIEMSAQDSVLALCKVAVKLAKEQLQLDRVAIFLTDDNAQTFKGTYGTDINGNLVDECYYHETASNTRLVQLAINTPDYLVVEDPTPLYHDGKVIAHGWNAALQLRSNNHISGLLIADNLLNKRPLSGHVKQLLRLFGANLGEMLARKAAQEIINKLNQELENKVILRTQELATANKVLEEANKQLETISLIDGLTGVANRRYFDNEFDKCWSKACRTGGRLSVLMLDADNFKSYNDNYGHLAGDECLKIIATILKNAFRRAGELVARYGGEEFVILICDSDLLRIVDITENALQNLYDTDIKHVKTDIGRVTLSAGLATVLVNQNLTKEALLAQADKMLYEAKGEGKNRLCYVALD